MTVDEIKNVVLEIIRDIDDEADLESLKPGDALRDQLDLDSMDFLDIVMELRKRYQIQIPEADYPISPPWKVASTISYPVLKPLNKAR